MKPILILNNTMSSHTKYPQPLDVLPDTLELPHLASVKHHATFNYYGPIASQLIPHAAEFLISNTDASVKVPLETTLQAFLETCHDDCVGNTPEKSCCWFTIRITQPHTGFDIPRWHQDGRMYTYDTGREAVARSKYALTLLGPPTLLLPAEDDVFAILKEGEKKHPWCEEREDVETTEAEFHEREEALRVWLAERFSDLERVKVGAGKVVRFSWGREDSPVHSEPRMDRDRVFMTLMFGSESELRNMCDSRGLEFGKFES